MSIDCNQGTNIKLFLELCCSKNLISLLFRDITAKLLVIACTFQTPIVLTGSKTVVPPRIVVSLISENGIGSEIGDSEMTSPPETEVKQR